MKMSKLLGTLAIGFSAMTLVHTADIVNYIVNPKYLPDSAEQVDTLKEGTFWREQAYGYSHMRASCRNDVAHAENNLTRDNAAGRKFLSSHIS